MNRIERRQEPSPLDVIALAYFAALQASRTPQDRAEIRYLDEVMATQLEELRFSASEKATAFLARHPCFESVLRPNLHRV
jgi:hypothetical protein